MSRKSTINGIIHSNHNDNPKRYWDHNNRRFIHHLNHSNTSYVYYDNILPYDYDKVYAYPDCNFSLYSYCRHNSTNSKQCQDCIKFTGGSDNCAIKNCAFFNNY